MQPWEFFMYLGFIVVGFVGMNVWQLITRHKKEMNKWELQLFLVSFSLCGAGLLNMFLRGFHIW